MGRFVIISVAWAIAGNVANPVAQKRRAAWAQVAKTASPEFVNVPPPRKNSGGAVKIMRARNARTALAFWTAQRVWNAPRKNTAENQKKSRRRDL